MPKFSCRQKIPNLIGHTLREQHAGMRDWQCQVITRTGKGAFFHCQETIVRKREASIQQPAHAERMSAADHADLTRRRTPLLRHAGQQLRHSPSHCPAPPSAAAQMPRHAATAMRRAQCDDSSGLLQRMFPKQGANQDAAQTVPHKVDGVGIERGQETRQQPGVSAQVGAYGRIGKRMNAKAPVA